MIAKVIKGFENIFIKLLARKKKVCIFALGLKEPIYQRKKYTILKIQSNEQKNVSTIKKKKKK